MTTYLPVPADVPMTTPAVPPAFGRATALVAPTLREALLRLGPELRPAVEHHFDGGGKRVRCALVLLGAAAAGADERVGVVGGAAIELIHNFSLIHDDIVDGDFERRHRPTVWARYGIGTAIIVGDSLATLAMQVLLDEPTPERLAAARRLADATQDMIGGQADDIAFELRPTVSVAECLHMERCKTGAILSCAAALGAVLAGAEPDVVGSLGEFGARLGIAYQAIDDVLGIWGDPDRTGKPVGNDLYQHKKTLPVAIALARGGPRADELHAILAAELSESGIAARHGSSRSPALARRRCPSQRTSCSARWMRSSGSRWPRDRPTSWSRSHGSSRSGTDNPLAASHLFDELPHAAPHGSVTTTRRPGRGVRRGGGRHVAGVRLPEGRPTRQPSSRACRRCASAPGTRQHPLNPSPLGQRTRHRGGTLRSGPVGPGGGHDARKLGKTSPGGASEWSLPRCRAATSSSEWPSSWPARSRWSRP